jgi:signal transduction histidine kinase
LLKPPALFGLAGLDQITHAMLWSIVANVGAYVAVSLLGSPSAEEHRQASLFVDVFRREGGGARFWRGTASVGDLHNVLARFLGAAAADEAFREYARARGKRWPDDAIEADADFVHFVEVQLAGAIGAASARIMVASAVKEEALTLDEVREILDEASQVVVYSHKSSSRSRTSWKRQRRVARCERAAQGSSIASRTTSCRRSRMSCACADVDPGAFGDPARGPEDRAGSANEVCPIITKETERLTRLINQVLDLAKFEESGRAEWRVPRRRQGDHRRYAGRHEPGIQGKGVEVKTRFPDRVSPVSADLDRLVQVLLNLLSNAVKFCEPERGRIEVSLAESAATYAWISAITGPASALKTRR